MNLLIISHTPHFINNTGEIVGWGPTVRELNHLIDEFDMIFHCAPIHKEETPGFVLPYSNKNIEFVPLLPSGGSSFASKLSVLWTAPANLIRIHQILAKVDVFQFRCPTGMGVYLIPWLNLMVRKKGWYKYAGNWNQKNPPMGYGMQRFWLKHFNQRKVTINGKWPGQKSNFISFENPCLTKDEVVEGAQLIESKDYNGKLNFCFVGRLETAKGVGTIIEAFENIKNHERIGSIHLVGDGEERELFEQKAQRTGLNFKFHGFLNRFEVAEIMKGSHIFLLPSTASEGFPKVIAEAANYGCIPLVSDVSSISQYVKDGVTGRTINLSNKKIAKDFTEVVNQILNEKEHLLTLARNAGEMSKAFTFERYNKRIKNELIASVKSN